MYRILEYDMEFWGVGVELSTRYDSIKTAGLAITCLLERDEKNGELGKHGYRVVED